MDSVAEPAASPGKSSGAAGFGSDLGSFFVTALVAWAADGFASAFWLGSYLDEERYARKLPVGSKPNKIMLEWQSWLPPMILYTLSKWEAVEKYPLLKDMVK